MNSRAEKWNMTGIWNGTYTYPLFFGSVAFVATLIDGGDDFGGTTHEPHSLLPRTLYATLSGHRDRRAVEFIKTYEQGGLFYPVPIKYEGTLNQEGTKLEGRWTITRAWSGKFLMIRSRGTAAAVSEKTVETA